MTTVSFIIGWISDVLVSSLSGGWPFRIALLFVFLASFFFKPGEAAFCNALGKCGDVVEVMVDSGCARSF